MLQSTQQLSSQHRAGRRSTPTRVPRRRLHPKHAANNTDHPHSSAGAGSPAAEARPRTFLVPCSTACRVRSSSRARYRSAFTSSFILPAAAPPPGRPGGAGAAVGGRGRRNGGGAAAAPPWRHRRSVISLLRLPSYKQQVKIDILHLSLPGDVLAAPASALCGWKGVTPLSLSLSHIPGISPDS